MVLVIALSASFFAMLVTGRVVDSVTARPRRLRERLELVGAPSTPIGSPAGTDLAGAAGAGDRNPGPSRARQSPAIQRKSPFSGLGALRDRLSDISLPGSVFFGRHLDKLRHELVKAGIPLKPEEMAGLAGLLVAAGFGCGMLLSRRVLIAAFLGAAGALVPMLWIRSAQKKRVSCIEGQLLNALVLIANSLRAGHSFMQAVELAARETGPPLGLEFARVSREGKMGLPVEETLANLTARVNSKDLELAITGVLIQRQVGGNLAQVLDSIAGTIDKRIKTKARIQVVTAQGRLSAWIISVLPFALGALVFGAYPEFGRIMLVEPLGVAMLAGAFVLLVIGILVIRKVVDVDV